MLRPSFLLSVPGLGGGCPDLAWRLALVECAPPPGLACWLALVECVPPPAPSRKDSYDRICTFAVREGDINL